MDRDIVTGVRLAVKTKSKKAGMPGLEESMESLGYDSLDLIEMTMILEEDFGVFIRDSEVKKDMNIEDIAKLVESKL